MVRPRLPQIEAQVADDLVDALPGKGTARSHQPRGMLHHVQPGALDHAARHPRKGGGVAMLDRRQRRGPLHPEAGGARRDDHLPERRARQRIVPGGVAQRPPRLGQQRLDPAQLHRSEAPRAAGEARLAVVIARRAQQVRVRHRIAGQVVQPAHARAHAAYLPAAGVGARRVVRRDHRQPPVALRGPHRHDRIGDAARAAGEALGPLQPPLPVRADQRDAGRGLGRPDAEHRVPVERHAQPCPLARIGIPVEQSQRVDMPLIQPPDAQVAATDPAQRVEHRGIACRRIGKPLAPGRDRREPAQQSGARQYRDAVGGIGRHGVIALARPREVAHECVVRDSQSSILRHAGTVPSASAIR